MESRYRYVEFGHYRVGSRRQGDTNKVADKGTLTR